MLDDRRTRQRHDDVRVTSTSLTTNDDDAYKSGAWTSRRLGGLRQQSSVDAQHPPSSEYPPYRHNHHHQQHRDSNEYASIWEPWPATTQDSQDSSRRTGTLLLMAAVLVTNMARGYASYAYAKIEYVSIRTYLSNKRSK